MKTIGTLCFIAMSIWSWACFENAIGILTAKDPLQIDLHFVICLSKTSGVMLPAPIIPRPPTLETEAANSAPEQ